MKKNTSISSIKNVGKIETFGDRYLALQSIDGGKSEASAD
jgi:hypothetical protein